MIDTNPTNRLSPQLRVLTEGARKELTQAALECLERIGVQVNSPQGVHLLAGAGARVEGDRVRIPPEIITQALETATRGFTLWTRDGIPAIQCTPGRVHFGPGPSCTYFQDPENGERRRARRGDAGLVARVCDALGEFDFVMGLILFDDVTPTLAPVYEFAELVTNTTKPVVAWANSRDTLEDIYKIAAAVAGDEATLRSQPRFAYFTSYESPLRHPRDSIDNLLWAVDHDIPVVYLGGPTMGLESPATGASALVIHLASVLSGLAIIQLHKPGAPVVVGGVPSAMDLRNARPVYGSPEMSLHAAAAAELARYLGLPFMGTAGASESKILDSQAAIEASTQVLMTALSGASLVHDAGFLDCADIGSLGMLVMLDEIIAMVKRIVFGIQVDKESIMLDLIEKVGPGKYFITERSSNILCRREIWVPKLLDRNAFSIWEQLGAKSMEMRVAERLENILATYQPPAIPEDQRETIGEILAQAELRDGQG